MTMKDLGLSYEAAMHVTPQDHIDHFKRFAAARMRRIEFSFARIVADVIERDAERHLMRSLYFHHLGSGGGGGTSGTCASVNSPHFRKASVSCE